MATYKVIQDIEAEDKLLGPFSFRQFVYLFVGVFFGFLCYTAIAKHASFLLVIFLPPMLFCFFFAWPWSPDQPTEVWALARIRFLFKPRKRIWDQSGIKEFVTITAPKQIERTYTDGLSQTEVRSRLSALAGTIDSRGWIVKDSSLNLATVPQATALAGSDRLVGPSVIPGQEIPNLDVRAEDDILDETRNSAAYEIDQKLSAFAENQRQGLIAKLKAGAEAPVAAAANWFTNGPASSTATPAASPSAPAPAPTPALAPTEAPATMTIPKAPKKAKAEHKPSKPKREHLAKLNQETALNSGEEIMIQPEQQHETVIAPSAPIPAGETLTDEIIAKTSAPIGFPEMPLPEIKVDGESHHPAVQTVSDPAILNLSQDNNLNIATLAREAKKAHEPGDAAA